MVFVPSAVFSNLPKVADEDYSFGYDDFYYTNYAFYDPGRMGENEFVFGDALYFTRWTDSIYTDDFTFTHENIHLFNFLNEEILT